MCVILAKYFKGTGWVLAKNRDQNYIPDVTFVDQNEKSVGEVLVMFDRNTKYCEGLNHEGVCIITASLTPIFESETNSDDGAVIYGALKMSNPKDAVEFLQKKKMTGYALVSNKTDCYLLEGARDINNINGKGDKEYFSTVRKIPVTEVVAKTNHGTDFKWAGFQPGFTKMQDEFAASSISRQKIAMKVVKEAAKPEDLINGLAKKHNDDLQMNAFRVSYKERQMRTIAQMLLVPKEGVMYIRPIQANMDVRTDFEMLRSIVLDNDLIKDYYGEQKKLRLTKIKRHLENGHTYVTCTEAAEYSGFKKFILS